AGRTQTTAESGPRTRGKRRQTRARDPACAARAGDPLERAAGDAGERAVFGARAARWSAGDSRTRRIRDRPPQALREGAARGAAGIADGGNLLALTVRARHRTFPPPGSEAPRVALGRRLHA